MEGSTKWMSVTRAPYANSWTGLLANVTYFAQNPQTLQTYVLDTADWAEVLCIAHVCAKHQKAGIEDFGYPADFVEGWCVACWRNIVEAIEKKPNRLPF